MGYIGISEYQQSMAPPGMDWAGLAYNAIAVEQWPYTPEKDDYLLAFGRVCEAKGFHHSIETAKRTGAGSSWPACCRSRTASTSRRSIEPHIDGEQIVYEGEVTDERKRELFAHAAGVPVPHHLAGAVRPGHDRGHGLRHAGGGHAPGLGPEVVDDGKTGFVCDDLDEFVAAVGRVGEIDPAVCRRTVEERFTRGAHGRRLRGDLPRARCASPGLGAAARPSPGARPGRRLKPAAPRARACAAMSRHCAATHFSTLLPTTTSRMAAGPGALLVTGIVSAR